MTAAALRPARDPSRHIPLSALPDDRLAKLAAQGSAAAFAAIYKRHHQEIYRYCRSIIGNEHDARDALQETMIKAMRGLEGESREIALRPWLFRIAHNESVSILRSRRPSASLDSIQEPADYGGDADLARERVRELFEDLAQLTPRQRGALVMRELNGLGFDEIAAALAISPAAAKQIVYEARQALLDIAGGREAYCREIRERISARDRRLLRGRRVIAHLRACPDCREFEGGIADRGQSLAALGPLPAAASAGILQQVLGAAGGGIGGGGIAVAAAGGSLTAVAKLGVAGVVAIGVGTIAIESRDSGSGGGSANARGAAPLVEPVAQSQPQPGAKSPGDGAATSGGNDAGREAGPASDGGGVQGAGASGQPTDGAGGAGAQGSGATPPAASPSGPSAAPPPAGAEPGSSGGGGSSGTTGGGPGSQGSVVPPGQGGTPPGQGGSPPGLDGELPPGLGGTPPGLDGELPPGQGGTPPGLEGGLPPGQGGTPPGQGGTPPGQGLVRLPTR